MSPSKDMLRHKPSPQAMADQTPRTGKGLCTGGKHYKASKDRTDLYAQGKERGQPAGDRALLQRLDHSANLAHLRQQAGRHAPDTDRDRPAAHGATLEDSYGAQAY